VFGDGPVDGATLLVQGVRGDVGSLAAQLAVWSDNVDLDAAVLRVGGVIAACATREERPSLPFWAMLFDNVTIRLLGSDDFPAEAKQSAAADLTTAAREGALSISTVELLPLDGQRQAVLAQLASESTAA
jgi:NADPH:quinone reductase-like Zn-dependent oxidoreductase